MQILSQSIVVVVEITGYVAVVGVVWDVIVVVFGFLLKISKFYQRCGYNWTKVNVAISGVQIV